MVEAAALNNEVSLQQPSISTDELKKNGALLLSKFIFVAIEERRKGNSEKFNFLVNSLQSKGHKKKWISAFSVVISAFNYNEVQILQDMLFLDISKKDAEFISVYCEFLENLVSFHSKCLPKVYSSIVSGFSNTALHDDKEDIHLTLQKILDMIPSSTNALVQVLAKNIPFKDDSIEIHNVYIKNLLKVCKYAPVLIEPIFELIIEKLLILDVEVTVDMDEIDEDEEVLFNSLLPDAPVKMDDLNKLDASKNDEEDDSDDESDDESESSVVEETRDKTFLRVKDMLSKIDGIVKLVFHFITDLSKSKDDEGLQDVFMCLISCFDRSVIRTHKAKYVPTLFFYVASLEKSFAETFVSILLARILDSSSSEYIGISSAGYLGSFLARAKYLDIAIVSDTLKLLTEWAHSYLDKVEEELKRRCFVWFAVVQCILYVFCFRWREMVEGNDLNKKYERTRLDSISSVSSNHGVSFSYGSLIETEPLSPMSKLQNNPLMSWWFARGGFQRLIYSGLNPLRVCEPNVSGEFDKITKQLEIVFCGSILSINEQLKSKLAVQESDIHLEEMIRSFFPFDPYFMHLGIKSCIEPFYLSWNGIDTKEEQDD